MSDDMPVNSERARHILGGSRPCRQCDGPGNPDCDECGGQGLVPTPWSPSYMSAVKKAMGIKSRFFLVSDVRKFLRSHPEFTSKQVHGGETFKALLAEAYEHLKASAPRKLLERIERKLA